MSETDQIIRESSDYREKCLREKGHKCDFCPAESNIVVHHIDGDRENSDIGNLIPVCESCHRKIHHGTSGFEDLHRELPEEKQWDGSKNVTTSVDRTFGATALPRGTITIPADIRRGLEINPDDHIILKIMQISRIGGGDN